MVCPSVCPSIGPLTGPQCRVPKLYRSWALARNVQSRCLKGTWQEYDRGKAEAGAGMEQGWNRVEPGKKQERSKAGVVHISNFA